MKITIVGAGRVGVHLAKYFADEQQDVFLVDKEGEHLSILESDFNLRTFVGEPTDFEILRGANSEHADIFVAVTANTAENLVACALAKSMGARKTIARVDKFSYVKEVNEAVVRRMGVDHVVFPDFLAAQNVINALEHPWCGDWAEFEGSIVMIAATVKEDSAIAGRYLKDLYEVSNVLHVSALRRNHRTSIPRGDDVIEPGDVLYITAVEKGVEKVQEITGVRTFAVRNIILMGGSTVSELVAKESSKNFSYTIVDKDKERCRELAGECMDCEIICGDASEEDVLEEAGINKCDAFVALTDNTESNILSCLAAQDMGVRKSIAEVEKEQLIAKAESFRLGSIINKPIITANAIFQLILDADVDSSRCFTLPDAEVGRLQVKEGSFLTKDSVMNLRLPRELTFAGLIREGRGEMVTGTTRFVPGDTVIVFCLAGALKKVEKLFGR